MATKHFTYDPDKVKELRMKVINLSLEVLNDEPAVDKWSTYKKELVMKIAPRVLPVLQEVSGNADNDTPIPIQISGTIANKNGINICTGTNSTGLAPLQSS